MQFVPTKKGYLRFMEESKVVYDAFEDIIASDETCTLSDNVVSLFGYSLFYGHRKGVNMRHILTVFFLYCSIADASLRNTGLERGGALTEDIEYATTTWGLAATAPSPDSPGAVYASKLRELAKNSPPAFICHYYNFYFAHTAGGRMIGKQVSEAALDGWMGKFYQWNGDVRSLLKAVRESLNDMAGGWSDEEKQACLEETPATFQSSGMLLRLIAD